MFALWEGTFVMYICLFFVASAFVVYSILMIAQSIDPASLPANQYKHHGSGARHRRRPRFPIGCFTNKGPYFSPLGR